jgi:hypothetical protein
MVCETNLFALGMVHVQTAALGYTACIFLEQSCIHCARVRTNRVDAFLLRSSDVLTA